MRERYELGLKVVCAVLAAWLLFQAGRLLTRPNPLTNVKIPAMPTLASAGDSATNSAAGKTNAPNGSGKEAAKGKTNSTGLAALKGTNSASDLTSPKGASNSVNTPSVAKESTHANEAAPVQSNAHSETNKMPPIIAETSQHAGTNGGPLVMGSSNLIASAGGTNKTSGTNANSKTKKSGMPPDMAAMRAGGPGRQGRQKAPDLAPPLQARVDKIVDSELLGPVIRPMPMALLGIAGNVAIIRSPSGQTGLVKEGDEMGGIKLLRIGINRVLVEQSGEKKELMIFSGYGGESLMPKENEKTNEPTSKKS
jgi:hypothetical protein